MSITVNLRAEIEQRLREEAAKSNLTAEQFLEQWAERTFAPTVSGGSAASTEEWIKAWYEWVNSHEPVTWKVDDDRESIYEGCGE